MLTCVVIIAERSDFFRKLPESAAWKYLSNDPDPCTCTSRSECSPTHLRAAHLLPSSYRDCRTLWDTVGHRDHQKSQSVSLDMLYSVPPTVIIFSALYQHRAAHLSRRFFPDLFLSSVLRPEIGLLSALCLRDVLWK